MDEGHATTLRAVIVSLIEDISLLSDDSLGHILGCLDYAVPLDSFVFYSAITT